MSDTTTNEIVLADSAQTATELVASFQNPNSSVFSTVTVESFADKLKVIASMTNAENLRDHLGKTLALTNWTAQVIDLTDENTGEVTKGVRLVLMTADGKAYACVSNGIAKSLQNILAVAGEPSSWPEPIKVKASEERGKGMNRYLTLSLA